MKLRFLILAITASLALPLAPCFADSRDLAETHAKVVQGNDKAQFNLGTMGANGEGTTMNNAEALKRIRKAAEDGVLFAQYFLGTMYANGQGLPRDYVEAAKWYRNAAEQGAASAQSALGHMYKWGEGVPRDYVLAYMWLSLAAAKGDEEAEVTLNETERLMSHDQIAEAQRMAREWKPKANKAVKTRSGPLVDE